MSVESTTTQQQPAPAVDPTAATPDRSRPNADPDASGGRPELAVGGAFVGGLALAIVLRRLSADD